MKAVVWHGRRDVRVETVPDPVIKEPNDIVTPPDGEATAARRRVR